MTKPEFPDLDSSSLDPKGSDLDAKEESVTPSFEIDSELDKTSKEAAEPSYPELFPMPDMTVGSHDTTLSSSSEQINLEFSDQSSTLSQDANPEPNGAKISASDSPLVMPNEISIEDQPEREGTERENSIIDLPESLKVPTSKEAEVSPIVENSADASPPIPAVPIIQDDSVTANAEPHSVEIELDSAIQTTEPESPKVSKKKSKKTQKNSLFKTTQRWGQKVSGHPAAQKITAFSGWPWVIVLGISGATTMSAFSWLAGLPPVPNCKIPSSSWSDAGRLYCADQAARSKKPEALASALEMVGDWDPDDPLYDQVNKLSDDWSLSIIAVAQRELDDGKLNEAIKLVEKVPKSSSYYDESRATIKDWQTNWKAGEKILEKARDAIQEQDWAIATDQMRQLVQLGGEHWQRRADKLISEMTIEQDAFRQLNVANDRAAYDTVSDIQSAIQLATKIDSKRLARKKLVSYVDRWSNQLVDLADYYYEVGDYKTAIDAAKAVPPGSKVGPQAIAYLQASRAQTASEDESPLGYIQAIAYTSQVPKDASILETTKDDINEWEANVQSWSQLEFAKLFTRIDQATGYQIAIDHAALVDPENPNRVKAQSLIAQWDKQLNSVSDRQTIARAAQLANNTDLASVHAAIAEARRVNVESPLRIRAQTLIAEWEGSIEKREDQPILDKAIAQANKGNLSAAIDTADTITSDRALYDEAQDQIYEWVSKIQIAEDDPILNEAAALARQGQLSAAIAKASEVGYGRALYYEAQDLIGGWIAERNRIEAARRPPEPEPEPYYEPEEQYYEPEEQYYEPQANIAPAPTEPYYPPEDNYIDSASGAGASGGPDGF